MSDPGTNNQAQPHHYPRRPERPTTNLDSPDWKARITSVTGWIEKIVENDEQLLHIGAIWGPRGSGKTSFLKTLCKQLPKETLNKLRIPATQPKNDATEENP
ncbi:MAG TPA: ATP-binding protein, partial [Nannocystis exedens]|nr:ATP-binding protein [Nannocystis exedens]